MQWISNLQKLINLAETGKYSPETQKIPKTNAREGIRTLELLQDWTLNPAPLT